MTTTTAKADGINAAMSIAQDIAAGTVDPAALEAELAAECRHLFGTVAGPEDGLFALQTDVARQVLLLVGYPLRRSPNGPLSSSAALGAHRHRTTTFRQRAAVLAPVPPVLTSGPRWACSPRTVATLQSSTA